MVGRIFNINRAVIDVSSTTPAQTINQALIQKTSNNTYIIVITPLNSNFTPISPNTGNLANTTTYPTFAAAVTALETDVW